MNRKPNLVVRLLARILRPVIVEEMRHQRDDADARVRDAFESCPDSVRGSMVYVPRKSQS